MSLPEDVEEELEGSEAQRLEPSDLYDPCVIGPMMGRYWSTPSRR